eukprot:3074227-Rhodomonas_salina.5
MVGMPRQSQHAPSAKVVASPPKTKTLPRAAASPICHVARGGVPVAEALSSRHVLDVGLKACKSLRNAAHMPRTTPTRPSDKPHATRPSDKVRDSGIRGSGTRTQPRIV